MPLIIPLLVYFNLLFHLAFVTYIIIMALLLFYVTVVFRINLWHKIYFGITKSKSYLSYLV